ncbi:mitogen-activated protein kinase-binding protein 1 [Elysia marginata]|uniref:Mitogen-activated protein kinase-binding protein 1 n=1 Tax=Elysia marginata TaxID=1093978 RepID=A0AAV4GE26_9GAST|nr:mitogen-activated protein kinase-binding protein 1 [Elysia marginata]
MNLDLVLGMSCNNKGSLACDQNSGLVAHTASGVLVLLNTRTNCQVKYFHVRKNCVSSASFSKDGRYVTTGETGFRPAVRVWRVKDGDEVATLYGHEFGIKCVRFSPCMREIISVGMEHDNVVNVWAWPKGDRLAANNIVDVIRAVDYSECGNFFVTSGCRHIKFWYPKQTIDESRLSKAVPNVQPLYGRPGLLGDCKDHMFIDVVCGTGSSASSVFAITRAGGLVIISATKRKVKTHKSLNGMKGTCIKAHDRVLFIGFSNGDVHMFNAIDLVHLGALPLPTFFRRTGLSGGGVHTLTFNLCTSYLTTAYNNSSLCVWDLQDPANVKQKYVAVYHNEGIAQLDFYSKPDALSTSGGVRETLVTVSHDSTVRLWGVLIDTTICYDKLNILSAEDGSPRLQGSEPRTLAGSGVITTIKVSTDRKYIVTGNQAGTICVYDKESIALAFTVKAHSREITCLAFYTDTSSGQVVLVSGSRDRLVQVMDATSGFKIVSTLNIHSSSITAVKVCRAGNKVCILSSASDRLINLSQACTDNTQSSPTSPGQSKQLSTFQLTRCLACVSSATDLAVDQRTLQMAVGFQDGNIRVFELAQLQVSVV